jgi:hypothetical protein
MGPTLISVTETAVSFLKPLLVSALSYLNAPSLSLSLSLYVEKRLKAKIKNKKVVVVIEN